MNEKTNLIEDNH